MERSQTLAVAESVTAGLLMANISLMVNATSFFQGGIIAYNLGQKSRHLGIDPIAAQKTNCVSEAIAQQMAISAASEFCSQWGIGITGYALPVPELNIKSCFAYCAIAYHNRILFSGQINANSHTQRESQQQFVSTTLDIFQSTLRKHAEDDVR